MKKPKEKELCVCGCKGKEHIEVDLKKVADEIIYVCPSNQSGLAPAVFKKR